jgi:hypothetical protein
MCMCNVVEKLFAAGGFSIGASGGTSESGSSVDSSTNITVNRYRQIGSKESGHLIGQGAYKIVEPSPMVVGRPKPARTWMRSPDSSGRHGGLF